MDLTIILSTDVGLLSLAAVSIAFVHTVLGPDHYVPFVAMAQAGKWSMRKTIVVTLLCGFGHVGSSIALGLIGIAMGILVMRIESVESVRGDLAGWLLLAFGLAYSCWGVHHAIANKAHQHLVLGSHGLRRHAHQHGRWFQRMPGRTRADKANQPPTCEPSPHELEKKVGGMTPWVLAVIFILGPCEPLIPLLMYPAARANPWALFCVILLFGLVTLLTMTSIVVLMKLGARLAKLNLFHRYGHALAGFAILTSGLAIKFGL